MIRKKRENRVYKIISKKRKYVTMAMSLGLAMVFSGCEGKQTDKQGSTVKSEQGAGNSIGTGDYVRTGDSTGADGNVGTGDSTGADGNVGTGDSTGADGNVGTGDSTGADGNAGTGDSTDLDGTMGTDGFSGGNQDSEEDAKEVTIVMVGDILLHTPVEESARTEEGTYDFSSLFVNMKDEINEADLALVNQEVIIGGEELGVSGYPAFNAPYEIADELVETGFDVILHATNHAMDKGRKGITNCLANWEEKYPEVMITGVYNSVEKYNEILVTEIDGISIAILNYTYGTNGIELPSDMPYAVDLMKEDKVLSDIEKAKELADFVVVCPHWGTEYVLSPDSYQKKWTQIFLENGVDLVIGTHPHVIEPVEMLYDEETDHEMLVYYSLGNFVNWTSGTGAGVSNRMVGGMAEITIGRDENGEVSIHTYDVEAICAHVTSGFGGVTVYPVSEYTDELASMNEIVSQAPDFSREYMIQLCDEVWGDLWR